MIFPVLELAKMVLPHRRASGYLFMLQAYLDDSGTHNGAPVLAIGGLIGTPESWDGLEQAWIARLREPLPGKPPVRAFHLSHLIGHFGEFRDYKPAEVDALRFEFRKIILESNLCQIATVISLQDWHELVVPPYSDVLGTPEEVCFSGIVINSLEFLQSHGVTNRKIAYIYDIGRKTPEFERLFRMVEDPRYRPQVTSVTWAQVNDMPPLQAADFIANENYRAAIEYLNTGNFESPHFRRLIEGADLGFILDREHIQAEIARRAPDGKLR
jgi:hypothetical protein